MYSIVITTYHTRFEDWLKPLIQEIKRQRPNVEIVLCVNGEKDYFDEKYRKELLDFIKDYPNVYPIFYPRFRSTSRMWNLGVQFSSSEKVLILSDDLTLEDKFFDEYEQIPSTTFVINQSMSAFSISKKELINMDWFDERFLGIGWEDTNFMKRYVRHYNLPNFPNVNIEWCKNVVNPEFYKVHNEKLAEYIREDKDRLVGQVKDKRFNRYSEFNRLLDVGNPLPQYPYEQFYLENKSKL